jgi:hypothetical protein
VSLKSRFGRRFSFLPDYRTAGGKTISLPVTNLSLNTELTLDLSALRKGQDLTGNMSTGAREVLFRCVGDWISKCTERSTINGAAAVDDVCMDAYLLPPFLQSSTTSFRSISKRLQVS